MCHVYDGNREIGFCIFYSHCNEVCNAFTDLMHIQVNIPNPSNVCFGLDDLAGWTFFDLSVIYDEYQNDAGTVLEANFVSLVLSFSNFLYNSIGKFLMELFFVHVYSTILRSITTVSF